MATGDALSMPTVKRPRVRLSRRARLRLWLRADWRGPRYLAWGVALALLTTLALALYYSATPAVILDPDSPSYLQFAQAMLQHGKLVDASRLPGYPIFINLVGLFAGARLEPVLGVAQAALFLLAMLETYAIGCLILRRAWLAFLPAALAGLNVTIISYMKPLLTEALSLALVTTLALTIIWWERQPSTRRFWAVALTLFITFMTRPEWVYLPIPLFAVMALIAWRRDDRTTMRATLKHGVVAVALMYAMVGAYALTNHLYNNYFGFSDVQVYNLFGKVLQYHLVGNAPPQYAQIDQAMQRYLAQGMTDPWAIARNYPPIYADHFKVMSGYSTAMLLRHPFAYLGGCWQTLLLTLTNSQSFQPLPAQASGALQLLGGFSAALLSVLWPILIIGPCWWLLWLRRGDDGGGRGVAVGMSLITLLVLYDLAMTTAGAYVYYSRLHTLFDALLLLVVVGALGLLAEQGAERGVRWLRARLGAPGAAWPAWLAWLAPTADAGAPYD